MNCQECNHEKGKCQCYCCCSITEIGCPYCITTSFRIQTSQKNISEKSKKLNSIDSKK